jgi:hypothetical protein
MLQAGRGLRNIMQVPKLGGNKGFRRFPANLSLSLQELQRCHAPRLVRGNVDRNTPL